LVKNFENSQETLDKNENEKVFEPPI